MKLGKALRIALDGRALLFLGSGFSYGSQNSSGKTPCTGKELARHLAVLCGYDDESIPLEDVSGEYIRMYGESALIDYLLNEYTLKSVSADHICIMELPWLRVYTTNYDLCAETAYQQANPGKDRPLLPVTLSDNPQLSMNKPTCVHLNGCITRLNAETLFSEFRLTDTSYVASSLEDKPWFRQFVQDIQVAQAIIVVGYSMSFDLDIKRHLSAPDIRDKLVFITKNGDKPYNINKLEQYGECQTIGLDGLANRIKQEQCQFVPSLEMPFTSFRQRTNTPFIVGDVQYDDLANLFYQGQIQEKLFEKDAVCDLKYLVTRTVLSRVMKNIMSSQKSVNIVTGALGSGKTVFLWQLIQSLQNENTDVFIFSNYNDSTMYELSAICSRKRKKVVILIDNYAACWDLLLWLENHIVDNIHVVLTERTSIHRIMSGKINSIFPRNHYYSLTELNSEEITQFAYRLTSNGFDFPSETDGFSSMSSEQLLVNRIKIDCHCRFPDTLLALFQSNDISHRLSEAFSNATSKPGVRDLVHLALFSTYLNLRISLFDMLELLHLDFVQLNLQNNCSVMEFFELGDSSFTISSSIIAKEMLDQVVKLPYLIDVLIKVVNAVGDSYNSNKSRKELLKSILSHSNFIMFLRRSNAPEEIFRFYNQVRNAPFCQNDPLFWEQFASACIDQKNYPAAQSCLTTAFAKAEHIPGYVPYQIATVQARYHLEKCLDEISKNTNTSGQSIIESICECNKYLFKYYSHPDNIKYYIFNIAKHYSDVWKNGEAYLLPHQVGIFRSILTDTIEKLQLYISTLGDTDTISRYKLILDELKKCRSST